MAASLKCSDLIVDKRQSNAFSNLGIYINIPDKT